MFGFICIIDSGIWTRGSRWATRAEAALEVVGRALENFAWGSGEQNFIFAIYAKGGWESKFMVGPLGRDLGGGEQCSGEEDPECAVCAWPLLLAVLAPAGCRSVRLYYPTCGRWACSPSALPGSLLALQNLRPCPRLAKCESAFLFYFILFYFFK